MESTLESRNIVVNGHRTSMRLEPAMWEALEEICWREDCSANQICTMVDEHHRQSSLTAAVRVFILDYFRVAVRQAEDSAMRAPSALRQISDDEQTVIQAQLAVLRRQREANRFG